MADGAGVPELLVVRPRAQADAWVAKLALLGVRAQALPLIEILPAPVPALVALVFARVRQLAEEADADADMNADSDVLPKARAGADPGAVPVPPLLVFVSPNAVTGFFEALGRCDAGDLARADLDSRTRSTPSERPAKPTEPAWPASARAAAVGPGTVAALRDAGVPADRIVSPPEAAVQFDSEALWACVAGWRWVGRDVWVVRGNGGRDWLGRQMAAAGAQVHTVQSYARAAPRLRVEERALLDAALADPTRWIWMFSSSEAIDHLQALAPGADWLRGRAFASHPRIAQRARELGFAAVREVAPQPSAVAAALAEPAWGTGDGAGTDSRHRTISVANANVNLNSDPAPSPSSASASASPPSE